MVTQDNNLLVNLHKWASKQDENFTTEAFVFLLNYLLDHEPEIAVNVLRKMTDGFLSLNPSKASTVSIKSQVITGKGNPDIEISIDEYLIFVEVKIESDLGEDQLDRYIEILNGYKNRKTKLILLSKYQIVFDDQKIPVYAIRWFQIYDWLRKELLDNELELPSKYLLKQFLEFAGHQNLVIHKVDSLISEGLKIHQAKYGKVTKTLRGVKTIDGLNAYEELHPLRDFFILMREAINTIPDITQIWFGVGAHRGGWIGFNLNNMDYSFSIGFRKSDKMTLEFNTYSLKIDKSKFDKKMGTVWTESGRLRWANVLNLLTIEKDFVNNSKEYQMHVIGDFLKESYEYAKTLKIVGHQKKSRNQQNKSIARRTMKVGDGYVGTVIMARAEVSRMMKKRKQDYTILFDPEEYGHVVVPTKKHKDKKYEGFKVIPDIR